MGDPFAHIRAGFFLGFRHRRELRQLLAATPEMRHILTLSPAALLGDGVAAIALDFDGVLAHHGASTPLPEAIEWMECCRDVFGEDKMFILSNKPTEERRIWFREHFPNARFIAAVRKKPYPDGLLAVAELAGVPPHSLLMIDDRLLTGCLAAVVAGVRPVYIRHPFISFGQRPFSELFFIMLRSLERLFVRASSRCCH